jgi:hypothetical protein
MVTTGVTYLIYQKPPPGYEQVFHRGLRGSQAIARCFAMSLFATGKIGSLLWDCLFWSPPWPTLLLCNNDFRAKDSKRIASSHVTRDAGWMR